MKELNPSFVYKPLKPATLLRYTYTMKFTHLKYVIQWFLAYLHSFTTLIAI